MSTSPWATAVLDASRPLRTTVVMDVSFLAYRAFYAMGHLEFEAIPTTVAFGVFREIQQLSELFLTETFAFCFDVGKPLRSLKYPDYKVKRKETSPDKEMGRLEVKRQIRQLYRKYLPEAGFGNLYGQMGYEADDLIASICANKTDEDEIIIVSSDTDLYQLLSDTVMIWNPTQKGMFTRVTFERTYGISPSAWPDVKALAGCTSDNIKGIKGIGEKTAAKYLSGNLKETTAAFDNIVRNSSSVWDTNLELVRLPYPDTKTITVERESFNKSKIQTVLKELGINSLYF